MQLIPQNKFYLRGASMKPRTLTSESGKCSNELLRYARQDDDDDSEKSLESTERECRREIIHGISYWEALMHFFKSHVGTAVFAMGSAFKNSGILLGPFLLVLLAVITTHCQHILLSTSTMLAELMGTKTCPSFAETVKLSLEMGPAGFRKLAPCASKLVKFLLCLTHLGTCCIYFIFISSNLQQIMGNFGYYELSLHSGMALIFVPILLSCFIRRLKFLVLLSAVANVGMALSLSMIASFLTQDLPPVSSRNYVARWNQLPLFFGTVLFIFNGIGYIVPFQNDMERPDNFSSSFGVLNVGTTLVTAVLMFMGFTSYLKYGKEIRDAVTLNLPQDDALAQAVKVITSLAILLTYALVFHVPVQILWGEILEALRTIRYPKATEYLFRTFLVLLTLLLAWAIPYLQLFISLIGAITGPILMMFFPPLIEIVVLWGSSELGVWKFAGNSAIIFVGIVICVTSTYETVKSIVMGISSDQ